jgi:hypothetical protein
VVSIVGIEFEDEEAEYAEHAGLPLAEVACRGCGRVQVVVPIVHVDARWCAECRPPVARFPERDRDVYPVACGPAGFLPSETRAATYGAEPAAKAVAFDPSAYPLPTVDSRAPWDGQGAPSTVVELAEKAVAASWDARVQRSRGNAPNAATGRPGALKWRYAVVLGNGEHSAYAVHDGSAWVSIMVWGRSRAWFPHASVTDLAAYIDARGAMDDEWYAEIRSRVSGAIERTKARAACNRGKHAETETRGGRTFCFTCGHDWEAGGPEWRAPKKAREGSS